MEKYLHIVAFDVPYPVDYGGVIDIFFTIKSLHEAGIGIYLHCFEYGRGEQPVLKEYCSEVYYYPRNKGHKGLSPKLPYIVSSRFNAGLSERILQDDHPVLLEGIHCTWILNDPRFSNRKIFVRLFNVEHLYYRQLYKSSTSLLKKIYYYHESKVLKKYERKIANTAIFIALSENDALVYRKIFGSQQVLFLPPFLPYEEVAAKEGVGCYCSYHGNLSVAENEKAANWLISEVFNGLRFPLVIAGKNPSRKLKRLVKYQDQACLVANPTDPEMQDIISKAQINIIPSFNCTGIKLKLFNALFNGRHCLVNDAAVEGTGLGPACHIGSNAKAFKSIITQLYNRPFTEDEIILRKRLLEKTFNNQEHAEKLIQWIW